MRICNLAKYVFASLVVLGMTGTVYALEEKDVVVYSGYFSRDQNDGKLAEMTGMSHYVKFFSGDRFVRLYIPYPYSRSVKPEEIKQIFEVVGDKYKKDVYIKDDFGVLEQKIIAHIEYIRRVNGEIMFDCGISAPCKVVFETDSFKLIEKGIVKDHITLYHHVKD